MDFLHQPAPVLLPATHPSKEAVRKHLEDRRAAHTPPPPPERIREELGWRLIPANKF